MLRVGLTGGIGAGKSTVAAALARRGAVVIDADRVAREVVEPGGAAYDGVVNRFGPGVVLPDGRLDRAALADVVFADDAARADLNALTHPAIARIMLERLAAHEGSDDVVVLEVPLLDERARQAYGLEVVVVVDVPEDLAVGRLVASRGFREGDARARVAAQMARDRRRALADVIVDNCGGSEQLDAAVDELWAELVRRRDAAAGGREAGPGR